MIDIRKMFAGCGYMIHDSDDDTTNIVCRHGHIYADGMELYAALTGTRSQILRLRKIGEPIMDGDFGELTIRFEPRRFRDVARIMMARQARLAARQVA